MKARVEIHKGESGGWWWRVVAKNNRVLCHSQMYKTRRAAQKGIKAAKRAFADA